MIYVTAFLAVLMEVIHRLLSKTFLSPVSKASVPAIGWQVYMPIDRATDVTLTYCNLLMIPPLANPKERSHVAEWPVLICTHAAFCTIARLS